MLFSRKLRHPELYPATIIEKLNLITLFIQLIRVMVPFQLSNFVTLSFSRKLGKFLVIFKETKELL